jgi:hypothetical protein
MKTAKMGARMRTDSFTPRTLRMMRQSSSSAAVSSLYCWKGSGRKLKTASTQAAMETVMHRM